MQVSSLTRTEESEVVRSPVGGLSCRSGGKYENGLLTCVLINTAIHKYSITPLIRINWDGEPSIYTEYPDN